MCIVSCKRVPIDERRPLSQLTLEFTNFYCCAHHQWKGEGDLVAPRILPVAARERKALAAKLGVIDWLQLARSGHKLLQLTISAKPQLLTHWPLKTRS